MEQPKPAPPIAAKPSNAGTIWIIVICSFAAFALVASSRMREAARRKVNASTVAAASASTSTLPTSTYRAAAKELVKRQLRDPGSAEFSDIVVKTGAPGRATIVCGYVNAKNGFGGMTGRQRFVAGGIVTIEGSVAPADMNQLWAALC